jgi:hypothetical protein
MAGEGWKWEGLYCTVWQPIWFIAEFMYIQQLASMEEMARGVLQILPGAITTCHRSKSCFPYPWFTSECCYHFGQDKTRNLGPTLPD